MTTSINSIKKKILKSTFLGGAFFTISVLFFFSGIFFGLDFTDTFYHLNQAINPPDGLYLYPILLSSWIIKGFIELVGPEIIKLRFINSFLILSSVFLPFLFFKTKASRNEILIYVGCILFLIAPLNANVLGYDTLSTFTNTAVFCVTLLFLKIRKYYILLLLSLLCAMSILIRMPNAIVLPIIMSILLYQQKQENNIKEISLLKDPLLLLLSTFTGVFLAYFFYYKEWSIFLEASLGSVSHDLKLLLFRYVRDGIKVLIFCSFIIATYLLFLKTYNLKKKTWAFGVNLLIYIFFAPAFLFTGYSYPLFLTSIAISAAVIHVYRTSGRGDKYEYYILLTFVAILFVNPFGSNLGFLKASFLFLLFPFILSKVQLKGRSFWISIFAVLIPLSIFGKFYRTYEDGNLFTLNKTLKLDKLYPIRTSEPRQEFIQEVVQEVTELKAQGVQVYFYGDKSHIFHYLYPETSLDIKAFNQPVDDLIFYTELKRKLKGRSKVAIFLMKSYPEKLVVQKSRIQQEIMENNFQKIEENGVEYFLRGEPLK